MKIHTFNTLWSGYLFVVNLPEKEPLCLSNTFEFVDMREDEVLDQLEASANGSNAACFSVIEKKTKKIGILVVLYDNIDAEKIAHEAVHIADWFFEYCGVNGENFSEGNEHYAYTVGWAAGCIANVLIKENNDSRRK